MEWQGAVVVVTGASRGIGRAVAEAVAARGARVGLIARTAADLAETLERCEGKGAVATADVADADQVRHALSELESALGPTDVLVANAGIGAYGAFVDEDQATIERLVRVNVLGTMYAIHAVLPGMIERRRGHIVTMGSIAGRIGSPFEALYSATKFAGVGLSEALATEVAPYGIGVSIVNPGPVDTEFGEARGHPYDRKRPKPVPASDVADAVVAAVEGGSLERYVPPMLRPAVLVRHAAPPLFRFGTRQAMRTELQDDKEKR